MRNNKVNMSNISYSSFQKIQIHVFIITYTSCTDLKHWRKILIFNLVMVSEYLSNYLKFQFYTLTECPLSPSHTAILPSGNSPMSIGPFKLPRPNSPSSVIE